MIFTDKDIKELIEFNNYIGIKIKNEIYFRENRGNYLNFLNNSGFLQSKNNTSNNTVNNVFSMNVIQRQIASYL